MPDLRKLRRAMELALHRGRVICNIMGYLSTLTHCRGIKIHKITPAPKTIGVVPRIPRRPQLKVAEFKDNNTARHLNPRLRTHKVRLRHHATLHLRGGDLQSLANDACPAVDTHQTNALALTNASFVTIGLMHGIIVQNDLGTSIGIIVLSIKSL